MVENQMEKEKLAGREVQFLISRYRYYIPQLTHAGQVAFCLVFICFAARISRTAIAEFRSTITSPTES